MGIHEIHHFFGGHTVFQVYDIHILEAWEYMRYIFFFGGYEPPMNPMYVIFRANDDNTIGCEGTICSNRF